VAKLIPDLQLVRISHLTKRFAVQ